MHFIFTHDELDKWKVKESDLIHVNINMFSGVRWTIRSDD